MSLTQVNRKALPARRKAHGFTLITSGFTLIELLVVIAIIAILAAILFPVFAQAREKARQSACLSNLKQIMLGLHMYTQDYDETFPPERMPNSTGNPGDGTPGGYTWRSAVNPYIKNLQVWFCPDDTQNRGWSEGYAEAQLWNCGNGNPQKTHLSYAYNGNIYNAGGANIGVGLPAVGLPSSEILVLETREEYPDFGLNIFSAPQCSYGAAPASLGGSITHSGMMNFGFIDGHVKAMKLLNTLQPNASGDPGQFLWFDPKTRTDWATQSLNAINGIKANCPNAGYL